MASGWLPPQPPDDGAPPAERPEQPRTPYGAPQPQSDPTRPTFVKNAPAQGPPNPPATASVVVGSIALALLLLFAGTTFILTVPASIVALVLARAAAKRIETGLTMVGAGPAQAGKVIAWIGIVLGILAGIVWIILLSSGVDVEGWLEDLRDDLERETQRNDDADPI